MRLHESGTEFLSYECIGKSRGENYESVVVASITLANLALVGQILAAGQVLETDIRPALLCER